MPYVLPTPQPEAKWYNDVGDYAGLNIKVVKDFLLAALTGQMQQGGGPFSQKNIPNPGYGQTGSPGTQFSVAGANPHPLAPPSTARYQPPQQAAPYATQPTLNPQQFETLIKSQQYQKNAQDIAGTPAENLKMDLANQQAQQQLKINEDVLKGDLIPVTLPTGQTIYMRPSKSGYVPIPQNQGPSARDQVRGNEFGALGTQTSNLPEELPNPKGMAEGTKATDTVTGQKYIVHKGAWNPN